MTTNEQIMIENSRYKQALDEIEKIVTLDKTHIKYAGSTLVICDDILDIIRKAKGEEWKTVHTLINLEINHTGVFYVIITKNIGIKPVEGQLVSGLTGIKILRQGRKNDRP